MDRESTGRRIKAARQLASLTVPQLAKRLDLPGLGAKTLGMIERGERALRPQEAAPLAHALGVPEAFLIGDEHPAGQDPIADRLDAIEQSLAEGRRERQQQAERIEGLLASIEARLREQRAVRDELSDLIETHGRAIVEGRPAAEPDPQPAPRQTSAAGTKRAAKPRSL